jgi:hypothetical protein
MLRLTGAGVLPPLTISGSRECSPTSTNSGANLLELRSERPDAFSLWNIESDQMRRVALALRWSRTCKDIRHFGANGAGNPHRPELEAPAIGTSRTPEDSSPKIQLQVVGQLLRSFEMIVSMLVEVWVSVSHRFRSRSSEHNLKIYRLQAVVDVSVDHSWRACNAFPRAKASFDAVSGFVLEEDGQDSS